MESDLGSPGKTRTLMIWTSWPADCLASWLAGWRSLVKPGFSPGEVFGVKATAKLTICNFATICSPLLDNEQSKLCNDFSPLYARINAKPITR